PDLHQTHTIAVDGSVAVAASFPDTTRSVTFKFRVNRTSAAADGKIVTLGNEGHIGFDVGRLEVVTGGSTFRAPFVGAPRDSAEIVVAIRPIDGQVRAWVDSDCVIAADTFLSAFSWAIFGNVAYGSVGGATVLSDLDIFDFQLPRHFDECGSIPDTGFCQLLYRAAIAANLSTSEVPFLGDH
ncbi:hypothetical protein LCGC14_2935490, partial [marine sediment metagenome]